MKIQTSKIFGKIAKAFAQGYTAISLQGSARSSKTYNTLIWLILYCINNAGTRLSIVRKTLPALKGSVLVDFKEILIKMNLYNQKRLNKSDLIYTFQNGSWVDFFSTDNEQKLRGRKRDILFVNEANELSYIEFEQLKMRTTRLSIVDYNPSFSDEHWICTLNSEPKTYHFVSTYKDNPFLERTVIEEIESLKHKNENLWRIYGLGLQSVIEGLIFTNVKVIPRIPDLCKKRCVGMDFGFTNDPTAIVEVGLVESEKALYIDEIVYRTQMLTTDIIKMLKSETPRHKIISESADPRLIQEIFRAGLNIHPVKKFQGSIDAGITKMQEYNIYITERSLNVIREFKNYVYAKDKEGKLTNTPVDAFNHAIDAVRYVILNEVLGGEKKAINLQRVAKLVY